MEQPFLEDESVLEEKAPVTVLANISVCLL